MKRLSVLITIILLPILVYAATNFPSNLDTYADKTSADTITSAGWNNLQDAIEALEAKVGKDSSAVTTSLDYDVAALETTMGTAVSDIIALETSTGTLRSDLTVIETTIGAATSTPTANTLVKYDADKIVHGAELNMTDEASATGTSAMTSLSSMTVKNGDRIFVSAFAQVGSTTDGETFSLKLDHTGSGGATAVWVHDHGNIQVSPIIETSGVLTISGVCRITHDGTLVLNSTLTASGSYSITTNQIYAFFLKKN